MEIGKTQRLKAARKTEHGFYLTNESGHEVLLPGVYIPEGTKEGDDISVFLYKDSEDRMVATTEKPLLELNQIAMLNVKELTRFGAFVDWGLPKDLLIPYAEQNMILKVGEAYPIILLLDDKTERLFGSTRVNKHLDFDDVKFSEGETVQALLTGENELGMTAVVNQRYSGLIFKSDIHKKIQVGEIITAYVKQVREDGKIDLSIVPLGYSDSIDVYTQQIMDGLEKNNGVLKLGDKSSPESIKAVLGMSKKAFKKAIGKLYKSGTVIIESNEIRLK